MKVVFSAQAEADLRDILANIEANFPGAYNGFARRLKAILWQIGQWPNAAQNLEDRPDVRMVPMMRNPYNVFYGVSGNTIEIIRILHGARQAPPLDPL